MAISEAAIESIAGTTGSIISLLATYPLLTISTLQTLKHSKKTDEHEPQPTAFQAFKNTLEVAQRSGWSGCYAGLKPALIGTAVSSGVYFYFYSLFRQAVVVHQLGTGRLVSGSGLEGRQQDIGVAASLAVAAAAGCVNVFLTNPVWVVVTQMQAQQSRRRTPGSRGISAWEVVWELYAEKGVRWLWQGVVPGLAMVANPTVQYMLYEWLLARLSEVRRSSAQKRGLLVGARMPLGWFDVFCVGALAKLGATLTTYPLLLVKNRMQALNKHTSAEMRYSGVLDALARIWKEEGLSGFYKGINTKMSQTVLAAALLMAVKEQVYSATKVMVTAAAPHRS